jgi:hypothetical protein
MKYEVEWRIDVEAASPKEAAIKARAAQVRPVECDAGNALPLKVARQPAHGGFDFGQFRHCKLRTWSAL